MKEFWKDALTIEFFSTVDGVADLYPIYEAKQFRPNWIENAVKQSKTLNQGDKSVLRCPGIFNIMKHGFIVPMWFDLKIKTENGKPGFSYSHPGKDNALNNLAQMELVTTHGDGIVGSMPKKEGRIKEIVKINTPWCVKSRVPLLMLPLAYPDNYDFESSIGILEPDKSFEINVQLYWNVQNGERDIKSGTPLMQLIPLTEELVNLVVRDANEDDMKMIRKRDYFMLSTFDYHKLRNKISEVYKKWIS